METCKDIIKQMRKRAKKLRDTTHVWSTEYGATMPVSINESIANEIIAKELDEWANKLEAVSSSAGEA